MPLTLPLPNSPSTPPASRWLVPAAFSLFAASMALLSPGFFEPYDETTHFLYAQKAWSDPHALLSIWARLGCTALYALVAPLGLTAARLLAAAITTLVALGTTRVLQHFLPAPDLARPSWFTRHATALVWLLLFAQPCFALNSFTVMTEMLLAASWIWTAALLLSSRGTPARRLLLASLVLGLGGLMRPEGWVALACWPALTLLWPRVSAQPDPLARSTWPLAIGPWSLLATLLALLPTLAWYLLGALSLHDWTWFIRWWPWPAASQFGRTGGQFLLAALISLALWMWIPILLAITGIFRNPATPNRASALLLLILPFLGLFLLHGLLGSLGLFGSLSLPRYFIAIAPMAAILALRGLIDLESRLPPVAASALRYTVLALALLAIAALAFAGHLPAGKNLTCQRLDLAIAEARRRVEPAHYPDRIIAGHPYVLYSLGIPLDTPADLRTLSPQDLAQAPAGTILIIDENLWTSENRPTPATLETWGYRQDATIAAQTDALTPTLKPLRSAVEMAPVRLWEKTTAGTPQPAQTAAP